MKETVDDFRTFTEEMIVTLESKAIDKNYNKTGINGPNKLYEFVSDLANGPSHAAGEIVYKIKRYMAKHDKDDLVKIACWAYLIWRFDDLRKR